MATRMQVMCIRKPNRPDNHERIESMGGRYDDGSYWKLSEEAAIHGIENGKWAFWVAVGGHPVDVIVETREGRKYLKTMADSLLIKNLLSLPNCP